MHPHHDEAKKSMQAKVKSMVGSHKDHEHPHDKGMRLACGGMADGGDVIRIPNLGPVSDLDKAAQQSGAMRPSLAEEGAAAMATKKAKDR